MSLEIYLQHNDANPLLSQPREELVPRVRVRARRVEALEQLRDVLREEATPNRHLQVVKRVLEDVVAVQLINHAQDGLEHLRAALGREDEFNTRQRLEAAQCELLVSRATMPDDRPGGIDLEISCKL